MSVKVYHRFNPFIPPGIKILIIGTFNPDVPCNAAHFYYSRPQNHFWRILPAVYDYPNLKKASPAEKQNFLSIHHIGLADLILSVNVETGCECNFSDQYLDDKVLEWFPVEKAILNHPTLKLVAFTRKSFEKIPAIRHRIHQVKSTCQSASIAFAFLPTPSRGITDQKLLDWKNVLNI
ncbi:uracil-DNA glycosylase family protein [Schleiferia thermophila]|uniref:G/U mismatch-specific uracil-DNA glycosylase n=1 Tax=Schleiferia thermophila TaxID=884107 RepID=A0A369ABG8_9FLAO|nr:hypothetical protein [Schleiferia thermophila]KFD40262.1 hypothetical protein AT05_00955 [Schleiferia thermophila str. Yellowstone]RCX05427.1 hypothetical protein DES35_101712 [Schleiferia thermophila]GCD79070.1 hypothetical protein JCM30197_03170 [Schleiferia thermophila]